MKIVLGFLLLFVSVSASAAITCKENQMTSNRFCSSDTARVGGNYYFFATNDEGTEPRIVISFSGLSTSSRPDGVMVKLDGGTPFKIDGAGMRPDVSCGRYRSCQWTVTVVARPSADDLAQITAASHMLVSFTEGSYVSDPIEVNPATIGAWLREWESLRN